MTSDEDLRRAFELMARGDMGGQRTEATPFGLAVFDDDLPLRYDCNYLLVDELAETVSAGDLIADAERLDRTAILVRDEPTGERLAAEFGRLGWTIHRRLMMVHRRPSAPSARVGGVREVGEPDLRPLRRAAMDGEPWATPEVVAQLLDAKVAIGRRVRTRFFAVVVDGRPVSATDLYHDDRTAQVEDVATLPEHRGRGYASALVPHAVEQAREAGCDLVFLVADAEDWPKELYRGLGFDDAGRCLKFIRPG